MILRGNSLLTKLLFGFYPIASPFKQQWDWTTLVLRKVIKSCVKPNDMVLDVGTGPYAVLAIFASLKLKVKSVTGIDYCGEVLENAQKQQKANCISLIQSDLFHKIDSKFDVIMFNTPYIDEAFGNSIGVFKSKLDQDRWSGGPQGTNTINRFLTEAKDYLTRDGFILLGVNNYYLHDNIVLQSLVNHGFSLIQKDKNNLTKACVYKIKPES